MLFLQIDERSTGGDMEDKQDSEFNSGRTRGPADPSITLSPVFQTADGEMVS